MAINQPNDVYEQEADAVANEVMQMPHQASANASFFKPSATSVQRKCKHCEAEESIQKKDNGSGMVDLSEQTADYIHTLSGGAALNERDQQFFGSAMGQDFSSVRLHTDAAAAKSAQAIDAKAYTSRKHIVFNNGQYAPGTESGKRLLAHELTHVVQQNAALSNVVQRAPNPPGWNEIHSYKHPGGATIRITHFSTKNVSSDPFNAYVAKARVLLQQHGLNLDVLEKGIIDFERPVLDMDDVKEVRMTAHKAFQDKQNDDKARLPVISTVYGSINGGEEHGINGQTFKGTEWLPFVFINAANKSADSVTLLHEIGHAASVPGLVDQPVKKEDAVENFMLYGNNRSDMNKMQILAIVKAYFSV